MRVRIRISAWLVDALVFIASMLFVLIGYGILLTVTSDVKEYLK